MQRIPKIVALIKLFAVTWEIVKLIKSSKIKTPNKIIKKQIIEATAIEEKASSSEDLFFNIFTQFAEKAYITDDNMISNEKYKLRFFEIDWLGLTKTYIPKKPTISPKKIFDFTKFSLKKKGEIRNVKRGIVPIKVEATRLSTWSSLQLIKLKGITLPTSAITKRSFLLFKKSNFIFFISQKKKRKIEAITKR